MSYNLGLKDFVHFSPFVKGGASSAAARFWISNAQSPLFLADSSS
jgi:hypothetical protein